MPLQYQLIYNMAEYIFRKSDVKCAVLVSKTPYLSALIACHGAKANISPPYSLGSCLLLPLEDQNIYSHVVIERYEEFNGQMFYFVKHRKNQINRKKKLTAIDIDCGLEGKPSLYVENQAILFPAQHESEWLGKHDIPKSELEQIMNDSFPAIIGQKNLVEYWKNKELALAEHSECTMASILNLPKNNDKFNRLNIYSTKGDKKNRHDNQIWINAVPASLKKGKYLIILSPSHSMFEEKVLEVNELYSNAKLATLMASEIPQRLLDLGIYNRSLSIVSLLKQV